MTSLFTVNLLVTIHIMVSPHMPITFTDLNLASHFCFAVVHLASTVLTAHVIIVTTRAVVANKIKITRLAVANYHQWARQCYSK